MEEEMNEDARFWAKSLYYIGVIFTIWGIITGDLELIKIGFVFFIFSLPFIFFIFLKREKYKETRKDE